MTGARGARVRAGALPIHPLLAAAYPVIFLFTSNAAEHVDFDALWAPLSMAVGGTAAVLLALGLTLRDWHRAGLLATLAVIGFFGYGHAWNAVSGTLSSQWPLIAWWALLLVVAAAFIWRLGPAARAATAPLNAVLGLVLLMNGWGMTQAMVAFGSDRPALDDRAHTLRLDPPDGEHLPDVYYIVLDRYAGSTALAETYGYDNEPFLTALEERGFDVARRAHANYIKTPLSLVSSLNMEFLDAEALQADQSSGDDRQPIHRLLRGSLLVPASLKALGYSYVHVANWWEPTATNADADRVFRYAGQDEFSTVLAQTTLVRAFDEPDAAPDDPWDWRVLYAHTRYALDRLDEIPDAPGPKFVFAHLLIPHPPYVFDADGSFMGRAQVAAQGDIESYGRQLSFANQQMLQLVDRITEASDGEAIILLQGDEGPFPARYQGDEWAFDWRTATDAEVEEKFGILFAMRVPGADLRAEGLHDAITPVNAFRLVFNARFGTDLEMLPDRSWAHEDLRHFFEFFEISERLRR